MVGLKVRMETAENELERLKRKRTDSINPERVINHQHPEAPRNNRFNGLYLASCKINSFFLCSTDT